MLGVSRDMSGVSANTRAQLCARRDAFLRLTEGVAAGEVKVDQPEDYGETGGAVAATSDDAAAACQYCQADCAADDDDKGEA